MDEISQPEARSARPGAYLISCYKCLREHEIHGLQSILEVLLLNEGWVRAPKGMICPRCPAASESPTYNKSREQERRAAKASKCLDNIVRKAALRTWAAPRAV